jgi:hypothetical protein
MAVAQIRTWVRSNDFFNGYIVEQSGDVFIPGPNKYPHIHIGTNYITYSKTHSNHMYLVETGSTNVNQGRVSNVLQDSNNAHILQVCRYMKSQF